MGVRARPRRELGVLTDSIDRIGVKVEALNDTDERLHLLLLLLHVLPHLLHALHRDTLSRSSNHGHEHRHKRGTSNSKHVTPAIVWQYLNDLEEHHVCRRSQHAARRVSR